MRSVIRCGAVCTAAALFVSSLACGGSTVTPSAPASAPSIQQTTGSPNGAPEAAAAKVNVNGVVSALNTAARTFVIDGSAVRVVDATVITAEGAARTFADILNGTGAHVQGTLDGATVVAATIALRSTTISGTVAALAGACPARTFTVGGIAVSTDATTGFTPGECADLADGTTVEVKGDVAAGVLAASRVELPRTTHVRQTDFEGAITAVGGSCPAADLTIASGVIHVTAETTFTGGSACSEAVVTAIVSGRGTLQADGSIVASHIRVDALSRGPGPVGGGSRGPKAIEGPVSNVTGTCPALTFTLAGETVQTNVSTQFIGSGNCGLIVNGKTVEVTGEFSTGSVALHLIATRVKVSK